MHGILNLNDQGMKQFKVTIVDRLIHQIVEAVID